MTPQDASDDTSDERTWLPVRLRIERGLLTEEAENALEPGPPILTDHPPEKQYEKVLRRYGDAMAIPRALWMLDDDQLDWVASVTEGALEARWVEGNEYGATIDIEGETIRCRDEQLPDLLLDRLARAAESLPDRKMYVGNHELWCLTDDQVEWLRDVASFEIERLDPYDDPPDPAPPAPTFEEILQRDWHDDLRELADALGERGRILEFDGEYGLPEGSYPNLNARLDERMGGVFEPVEWEVEFHSRDEPWTLRAILPDGEIRSCQVRDSDWVDQEPWLELLNEVLEALGDDRVLCSIWDADLYGQSMGVVFGTPDELKQLAKRGLPVESDPMGVTETT